MKSSSIHRLVTIYKCGIASLWHVQEYIRRIVDRIADKEKGNNGHVSFVGGLCYYNWNETIILCLQEYAELENKTTAAFNLTF